MKRVRLFLPDIAPCLGYSIRFSNQLRWLVWPEYISPSLTFAWGWKKLAGLCIIGIHARGGIFGQYTSFTNLCLVL